MDGEEETVAGLRRRRLGEGESERRRGSGSVGVDGAGVCAATEPDYLRACCTAAVLVRCGGEGRGGGDWRVRLQAAGAQLCGAEGRDRFDPGSQLSLRVWGRGRRGWPGGPWAGGGMNWV